MSTLHLWNCSAIDPYIEAMLQLIANIDVRNSKGERPLHFAVLRKHGVTIELLPDKRADINVPNNEGNTPLHYALINYDDKTASLLTYRGADLDIPNKSGITSRLMSAFDKLKRRIP